MVPPRLRHAAVGYQQVWNVGCASAHHIDGWCAEAHPTGMIEHDLQYAIELARAAGKLVLEQYGKVERLTKTHVAASSEAVTEADRAAQRTIVAGLKRRYPDDGII